MPYPLRAVKVGVAQWRRIAATSLREYSEGGSSTRCSISRSLSGQNRSEVFAGDRGKPKVAEHTIEGGH